MTTEQTEPAEELPCLFDSKGALVELSDEAASCLSKAAYQKYAAVADANNAVFVLDKQIHDAEAEVHRVVRDLRRAESDLQTLPRKTHTDLVCEALCAQTAGRIAESGLRRLFSSGHDASEAATWLGLPSKSVAALHPPPLTPIPICLGVGTS